MPCFHPAALGPARAGCGLPFRAALLLSAASIASIVACVDAVRADAPGLRVVAAATPAAYYGSAGQRRPAERAPRATEEGPATGSTDAAAADAARPAETPSAQAEAEASISGSPWPGVIDHLLQRPQPGQREEGADIHINYPSLGDPAVDTDIRQWVTGIANAFETHLNLNGSALDDAARALAPLPDPAASSRPDGDAGVEPPAFELWGSYSVSRPSDAAASITFEIWNYAGASHGNLDILTLNYSLITGQRLAFMDLFEKPETALELMSGWARRELAQRLGVSARPRILEEGTAPLVENFSSLTLTPQGICINFQPYQVAPWAAGVQKVEMPLEALLPAGPLLALWGR